MRQVSIYRKSNSSAAFTIWADEDKPTAQELTPEGAELIVYTRLPSELVEYLLNTTQKNVSNTLADYLP